VRERPRVAGVAPQKQRVRGEERQCGREPPGTPACDQDQRRHEREPGRPREHREADDHPCPAEAAALGEHECREREEQEERLRVDGLQEERRRKERQVEHGSAAAVGAEPPLRDALQQDERRERSQQRDGDPGDDVVPAEHASSHGDEARVERVERRLGGRVAVFGDAQEVD
jgi:hypothetical protein